MPTVDDGAELRAALQAIVEGTSSSAGQALFPPLVRHLAEAIGVAYASVGEFLIPPKARTLASWEHDRLAGPRDIDVTDSPNANVLRNQVVHYTEGVARQFPREAILVERKIEGYMAVPLLAGPDRVLGFLSVFDSRPLPKDPRRLHILQIFAARATAELERSHAEQRLLDSEARYRDLFENAPNAYIIVSPDGFILDANRRVSEMLGYSREEMIGAVVHTFVPDTASGKLRSLEVSRKQLAGESVAGWEMEVRRKDGRPLWIQMWMEPERGFDGAIKGGRSFFFDITDRVLAQRERARLQEQNLYLREEISASHNFDQIIGRSEATINVLAQVACVAPTDASVLVTGETGTGKELIARAIHSTSKRRDKPLIKVNCAALPAGLVESELFGHERGAFGGAIARRLGRFELADGGTIFLDEVGELPPEAQVKLLRVLQEREFDRVGGTNPVPVDVRIVAATNRDLAKEVAEKRFREDLYYRLNVFPIPLPPLRERRDDIPLLVRFMVNKFAQRTGKRIEEVGQQTMERLAEYYWPGNIRELENVLERAVILARGPKLEIDASLLPATPTASNVSKDPDAYEANGKATPAEQPNTPSGTQPTLQAVERDYILTVLRQTNWLITGPRGAAQVLGINASTLRSRMKRLEVSRPPG